MLEVPVGRPFNTIILYLMLRCNLACDYCHVFFMEDQSWRDQRGRMPLEVVKQAARRIAEHIRVHQLSSISIALHGGEPLLGGQRYIAEVLEILRNELLPVIRPIDTFMTVQTNGVLLTEEMLQLLEQYGVGVGVSLDGDYYANRHRLTHDGKSSFEATVKGLTLLSTRHRCIFNGILAVIDPKNDPKAAYDELCKYNPPSIDFLLLHGYKPTPGLTPYGDWLVALFDHWASQAPPQPDVRFFRQIMERLLKGGLGSDLLRQEWQTTVAIATDGTIEQLDTMKGVKPATTGYHINTHPLDAARMHPDMIAQAAGINGLCQTCRDCKVVKVCGGGQHVHRFRNGSHNNPSVYCEDLQRIIYYVERRLRGVIKK